MTITIQALNHDGVVEVDRVGSTVVIRVSGKGQYRFTYTAILLVSKLEGLRHSGGAVSDNGVSMRREIAHHEHGDVLRIWGGGEGWQTIVRMVKFARAARLKL